ncbi:MAG TPA: hypothetical protein VL049_02195 [Candidatus Dormibacteraeota bacterium]|nr:hypothetical protein [Candidatus Dormibacteraeota bacterium]
MIAGGSRWPFRVAVVVVVLADLEEIASAPWRRATPACRRCGTRCATAGPDQRRVERRAVGHTHASADNANPVSEQAETNGAA